MPDFSPYTRSDLDFALRLLQQSIYTVTGELCITAWRTTEPVSYLQRTSGQRLDLQIGDRWGSLFDCAWFHFTGQVPAGCARQELVLLLDVNGEMCVYDQDGQPLRGLTNATSEYDYSLGRPGKRVLPLGKAFQGGESLEIWADAGANDLFGRLQEQGEIKEAHIAICHPEVRALFYDFEVLLDFLKVLPENSARHHQVHYALRDAAWILASGLTSESLVAAQACLSPMLAQRGGDPSLRISAIGHAHIDLAWLWPLRESHRKAARTFSTVLANMDTYPGYHFGASQAQLFQWVKDDYPQLYQRIKERVREGRFEVQGAMWVEADTNVSGGEALVRQVLLGKRFFKAEFGVDIHHLWLPDVFGYTAALPQILKKAGVEIFMTQKLSWNLVNQFPHQSFRWQGLDGSVVLTHMLPEETYNSPGLPRALDKLERNYRDKGRSTRALLLFGIGDGGGGPGEEHIERLNRLGNLAGLQPLVQEPAARFFEAWSAESAGFPTWVGELYLERHTGTLTTEARNKWYNRRMEQSLRELEWVLVLSGQPYPAARLEEIWREVLLYQFHDILPGSSIKRVYDESLARYAALHQEVLALTAGVQTALAAQLNTSAQHKPVVLFNSLSWPRVEWLKAAGAWKLVEAPALGCRAVDFASPDACPAPQAASDRLENELIRVLFDPSGAICSVYDKANGREVLPPGGLANLLCVYRDQGDAWDIPLDYAEQTPRRLQLAQSQPGLDGPQATLTQIYRTGHSELVIEIVLLAGSRRLDFNCRLRWRETAAMLRTSFPVDILATEAACEIQFGHIRRPTHRNTTWDLAKDEVPCQKWIDLSQRDYGAALLNDSKYGCKVKDGRLDLTLLRSVPYPGPRLVEDSQVEPGQPHHAYTDQTEHVFRYAFFPHSGDLVAGGVVRAAYEFNFPLHALETPPTAGVLPAQIALLEIDAPEIIVEAVKKAEDSSALILRLYESAQSGVHANLRFGLPVQTVEEVNLMEEPLSTLPLQAGTVQLTFQPFEIKTLKVTLRS